MATCDEHTQHELGPHCRRVSIKVYLAGVLLFLGVAGFVLKNYLVTEKQLFQKSGFSQSTSEAVRNMPGCEPALPPLAVPAEITGYTRAEGSNANENNSEGAIMARADDSLAPSAVKAVTDKLFQETIDVTVNEMPITVKNIGHIMQMNAGKFEPSVDERIQSILEQYNDKVMGISALRLRGQCCWNRQKGGKPHEHTMEFNREGVSLNMSCQPGRASGKNGLVFFDDGWDEDGLDLFYLFPLAVFDPSKFQTIENETIEVLVSDAGKEVRVETVRIQSKERILYFGRDDGQLKRICLRDQTDGKVVAQLDLSQHISIGSASFPSRILISNISKSYFRDNPFTPDTMELRIAPEELELSSKQSPEGP